MRLLFFFSEAPLCRTLNCSFVIWRITDWGAQGWGGHLHPLYKRPVSRLWDGARNQPLALCGKQKAKPKCKRDLPCLMAAGSQTSRGNHLGGYPVPRSRAVPLASGCRGKDHVSHTQPETSGLNQKDSLFFPKMFWINPSTFLDWWHEGIPAGTRLQQGRLVDNPQSDKRVDDTGLLRNDLNVSFCFQKLHCLIFGNNCNVTEC